MLGKHPARTRSYGKPSRRGLQPTVTTTNPLRGEKTGQTTKKLTTVKSHAVRQTRRRKPHPRTDIGWKVREAPPIPAGRGRLEPHGRPSSQNDQIGCPNSLNDQISRPKNLNNNNGRPSSLNDRLGLPNNRTIRLDNLIAWLDPQKVQMIKQHAWKKNYVK